MTLKDTYRVMGAIVSFHARNINNKLKHLSDFAAVTLKPLCYLRCPALKYACGMVFCMEGKDTGSVSSRVLGGKSDGVTGAG